ncbi:MAG: DUF4116 domain-containing protein [Legionella sp.]|nr:DUF4116 domain-containing protein [Legionella sp.]
MPPQKHQKTQSLSFFDSLDDNPMAEISSFLNTTGFASFYLSANKVIKKMLDETKESVGLINKLRDNDLHFKSFPKYLQTNHETIINALKHDGFNLRFLSTEQKNDEDTVMVAVNQNPDSLRFASRRLIEKLGQTTPINNRQLTF